MGLDYEHMVLASAGGITDPALLHAQHEEDEKKVEDTQEKVKDYIEKLLDR